MSSSGACFRIATSNPRDRWRQKRRFCLAGRSCAPTKNQILAGLRYFFDALVTHHMVVLDLFQPVRAARHPFGEGRTLEVIAVQTRQLLDSIETSHVFEGKPWKSPTIRNMPM